MAPVARRYRLYEEATSERALQDAVAALHPNRQEAFFEEVAAQVGIQAASVKGTFYKVLRDGLPLPPQHRAAYIAAGISPGLLDALAPSRLDSRARTRLRELEVMVAELYLETARGFEALGHRQHGLGGREEDQEPRE